MVFPSVSIFPNFIIIKTSQSMKTITIFIFYVSFLVVSCKNLCVVNPEDELEIIPDSTRFKELETPIEGTLLFTAGPNHYEADSTVYMNDQIDFYQLSGNTFSKLNNTPIDYNYGLWHFQWSNNGNYLAFFHDKLLEPWNTDDIAVMDFSTLELNYLTESVGDANVYDEIYYNWALDESFIYFSAIPLGTSEYDDDISPDIYRAKPDGSLLEQMTDNDYYEAHAIPSPDGSRIFYSIFPVAITPDSVAGCYVYDVLTKTSKKIITKEELDSIHERYEYGVKQHIYWHPTANYILINTKYRQLLIKIDIESGVYDVIEGLEINHISDVYFSHSDENLAFIYASGNDDSRWKDIYSIDLTTGITENLTYELTTLDNHHPYISRATVSPSDNYIAFTALINSNYLNYENYKNQKTEIYMLDVHTKEVTRLTNGVDGWEGHLKWIE